MQGGIAYEVVEGDVAGRIHRTVERLGGGSQDGGSVLGQSRVWRRYPTGSYEIQRLANALYDDEEERWQALQRWSGQGLSYAYEVWENNTEAAERLAERYDWVIYLDDYPSGAITWVYLGHEPLPAGKAG